MLIDLADWLDGKARRLRRKAKVLTLEMEMRRARVVSMIADHPASTERFLMRCVMHMRFWQAAALILTVAAFAIGFTLGRMGGVQ